MSRLTFRRLKIYFNFDQIIYSNKKIITYLLVKTKAFSSFSVNDIDKAKNFYGKLLGLDVSNGMQGNLNLNLKNYNTIFIYPKPNHLPASFTILNFYVENIDTTMDQMIKNGVQFIIYDDPNFKTDKKGIYHEQRPLIAWFKRSGR